MKQIATFITIMALSVATLQAQELTQNIRGRVIDQQSKTPLPGANVIISDTDPVLGGSTDPEGYFLIKDVPVGRVNLNVSFIGYAPANFSSLMHTRGKELYLEIELTEMVGHMEAVTVRAKKDNMQTNNELAMISARSFDFEEASRYAGARNDPARMAQNFAGVSGANDTRNDIVIRGNSPTGVLWRLEGMDIPNPNHFAASGTTGGPVSMLNHNMLAKSDFMTSAFPAQYGNAGSGVFDLQMRKGNAHKREHIFQVGFNGFEFGTEGPFSKDSKASYLLNYRYSTLGLMKDIGLSPGTGDAVPYYQDFSFKVDVPTQNLGRVAIFGVGGKSSIDLLGSESAGDDDDLYANISQDVYNRAAMTTFGLSHTHYFNKGTYGKLILSHTRSFDGNEVDSLSIDDRSPMRFYQSSFKQQKLGANYQINSKINARNSLNVGAIVEQITFNMIDSVYLQSSEAFQTIRDFDGGSLLLRNFGQWHHRINNALSVTAGLHSMWFALNNSFQVEPRAALKYRFNNKAAFNLGYGLHSQLQPIPVYFITSHMDDGSTQLTNKNLDFQKSHHFIAGLDYLLADQLRLKSEVYYQHLYNVAVHSHASTFSLLNAGADFGLPSEENLVNNGYGRNYGMEITLEKFFSNNYYFLTTASLFDSKYQASDGEWRNTAFNGRFVFNALFGREFALGSANKVLIFDIKSTLAGGQYVTPIDLEASINSGNMVIDHTRAFSIQNPNYFRTDLRIGFRMNGKRVTQEWLIDIQNVSNHKNLFREMYNPVTQQIDRVNQIGFFPLPQYRLTF